MQEIETGLSHIDENSPDESHQHEIQIDQAELTRLTDLAQLVGGDFGMNVKLGNPGGGSYFDSKKIEITIDPVHTTPEMAEMVVAHEGGHRATFRSPAQMDMNEAPWAELGFGFLINSIEDPAANTWVVNRYPGLKDTFDDVYSRMLEDDGAVLSTPELDQLRAQLGYTPKFIKFGSEIIRRWSTGKFSEELEPDVRAALERTIDYAETAYKNLPGKFGDNREVTSKARTRVMLTKEKIWPEMQELIKDDLATEEFRQMLKEAAQSQGGGEGGFQIPENLLPEDLKKELEELMKENQNSGGKSGKKEQGQQGGQSSSGKEFGTESDSDGQTEQNGQEATGNESGSIPMDKASDKLKEALKKAFGRLTPEQQKEIREKAKKQLEDLEDAANKAIEGKLAEDKPQSHQEREENSTQQNQNQNDQQKAQAILDKLKNLSIDESQYDQSYRKVGIYVNQLVSKLNRIFIPNMRPGWKSGMSSGPKLNLDEVLAYKADKTRFDKIWEKRETPTQRNYRFSVLVDLSGSMGYQTYDDFSEKRDASTTKIKNTFPGIVTVVEALDKVGVKTEIIGFDDPGQEEVYKSYTDNLDNRLRQRMSRMLSLEGHGGGTGTTEAVEFARSRLEKNPAQENFILVLTDGEAADPDTLEEKLKELSREGVTKVVGVGIGPGTKFVTDTYNNAVFVPNLRDLPRNLSDLFEDMVVNPAKYK